MNTHSVCSMLLAALVCGTLSVGQIQANPASAKDSAVTATCAPGAFLTFESGKLAAVDWVEQQAGRVHTRSVLTQSNVIDATIEVRPDGTAAHSSVALNAAGEPAGGPQERDLGEGAIYWSDMIASSLEQAVLRARLLGQPSVKIQGASLFSSSRSDILVDRVDATDWVVSVHGKRYVILSDDQGCVISASLPDYGVTIERRANFSTDQYPLWPAYAAPPDGSYRAMEVSISAPQGHILAGTLTIPANRKPTPAAVLITGLSPSERNGGSPPWMPLRDFADVLTRAGISVLRVDDRGEGKSTGDHKPSTTLDEADDVQTEIAWLRSQPGIDPKRIALVGYSEGGLIAPMIAAKDRTIAAIITLAGSGVPGPELARYQIEQAVIHDPGIAEADRENEIAKQLAEELSPRESSFLAIDPLKYVAGVRCPALIIQGAMDLHVPLRSSLKLAAAMRANGNSDVTVRLFPGVSHSLLPDPNGPSSGWVYLPGFITAPQILDVMARWAAEKLGAASGR